MENKNDVDMQEYERISKVLGIKNEEATISQLKDKLHYLVKQKFELYKMIEQITKDEKDVNKLLKLKTT